MSRRLTVHVAIVSDLLILANNKDAGSDPRVEAYIVTHQPTHLEIGYWDRSTGSSDCSLFIGFQ